MSPVTSPPSLRELQTTLADTILNPGNEAPHWLLPPPRGSIFDRIGIYTNGYPARTMEAIAETFPAVTHLIGHRETHNLCERYVKAITLHSYNLNDIGAELPQWLLRDPLTERFPFLPDLAGLEWNVAQAFHAFDDPPLATASLNEWTVADWEQAVLRFQPSVSVLTSAWPVRKLWDARDTPLDQVDIDLRDRPDHVLVYRSGLQVYGESITAGEVRALTLLLAGQRLGNAAEVLQTEGFAAADVSIWFAGWSRRGLIRACEH